MASFFHLLRWNSWLAVTASPRTFRKHHNGDHSILRFLKGVGTMLGCALDSSLPYSAFTMRVVDFLTQRSQRANMDWHMDSHFLQKNRWLQGCRIESPFSLNRT